MYQRRSSRRSLALLRYIFAETSVTISMPCRSIVFELNISCVVHWISPKAMTASAEAACRPRRACHNAGSWRFLHDVVHSG